VLGNVSVGESTPIDSINQGVRLYCNDSAARLRPAVIARMLRGASLDHPMRTGRTPKDVRILPPIFRSRDRRHSDSHKTYGNPEHGTACRKTDDFPGPVTAALNGRLMAFREKG
jgi:hypothetical protein